MKISRETLWLLALLVLGAVARALYLAHFSAQPDFTAPHVDADFHNYWARALAFGDWTPPRFVDDPKIREIPFFRPPGYPYFLAALYRIFGPGWIAPRIVQMFGFGLLNVFLTYRVARRVFPGATALVSAAGMSLSWISVYFEGEFQEPAISTTLVLLLVACLMRWAEGRARMAVLAGLCLGGLTLIRPNTPLLLGAIAPWMFWIAQRACLRPLALLVVAMGIVVAPATLRNYVVAHDLVVVSSNGGINAYIGNNDRADGLVWGEVPGLGTLDTCYDHLGIVRNLERRLGRTLKHSEVSSYFAGQAAEWARTHPGRFLWLIGRKTLLFFGPKEAADNKEVHGERAHSWVLRLLPVGFPLAFGLALPAALLFLSDRLRRAAQLTRPAPEATRLLLLSSGVVLVWWASYLPFAICSRYRVPLLPLLLWIAAPLVVHLAGLLRARRLRPLATCAVACAAGLALAHTNAAGYHESYARWHYQRALAFSRAERWGDAIPEYRSALAENPNYVAALNDLGAALARAGRFGEALPVFERYATLRPGDPTAQYNLGAALEATGRVEEARLRYEETLRLHPNHAGALAGQRRLEAMPR